MRDPRASPRCALDALDSLSPEPRGALFLSRNEWQGYCVLRRHPAYVLGPYSASPDGSQHRVASAIRCMVLLYHLACGRNDDKIRIYALMDVLPLY